MARESTIPLHTFDIETYHRMIEAGVFREDDRVELIQGRILDMTPIGKQHAACVKRLNALFHQHLQGRVLVGVQDPILLASEQSEPQPDLTLLRPREDFYEAALPGPEDLFLVVEVADTSQDYDRGIKIPLYARAGIPEAWLVDLKARVVEVYRDPSLGGYRTCQRLGPGDTLSPLAFPDVGLPVEAVVGRGG